jgi:hypothetical protein
MSARSQPPGTLFSNQGRPVRGRSHRMITVSGVRRLRGRLCRWTAALAKASACRPDCRFSRASAIHSRMTARRTFDLAIWIPFRGAGGTLPGGRIPLLQLFRSVDGATPPFGLDRSAIVAPEARNRIHARCRARQRSRVLPLRREGFRSPPASGRQPKSPAQRPG